MNKRILRRLRLKHHQSLLVLSSGSSGHLCHELERPFVRAEIRIIHHRVGIQDTYHAYPVEVQSFGNHLRTNQNIRLPLFKVVDDTLVGRTGTGGIQIHSGHFGFRKNLLDVVFNFFRAESAVHKFHSSTSRTGCRHGVGIAAIVTRQLVKPFVIGQTHIAVLAAWYPSAGAAFNHRGKTPSVLEQDDLFFLLQCFPYFL